MKHQSIAFTSFRSSLITLSITSRGDESAICDEVVLHHVIQEVTQDMETEVLKSTKLQMWMFQSQNICPYNEWSLIRKIKNLYILERIEMVCLGHGQNLYFSILIIPKFKAKEWHWIDFLKFLLLNWRKTFGSIKN